MSNVPNSAVIELSKANQALANATTPAESKAVEAIAAAAKAYYKELELFEGIVEAERIYILARRKTTDLILKGVPLRKPGRYPNSDIVVGITEIGFTPKQWERRVTEFEIPEDIVDFYFDDCIVKHYEPTIAGLVRYSLDTQNIPHVTYNSGNNEWYTPPEYIEAAKQVMGAIDLDPASSDTANEIVGAKKYYTIEDDGLRHDWKGRVWMNPPYATELIGRFTEKLAHHYGIGDVTEAIVLVNNATETAWLQRLLVLASAVCFIKGRVKFIDMSGYATGAPLQGQVIVYLGDNAESFAKNFSKFGVVLWKRMNEV